MVNQAFFFKNRSLKVINAMEILLFCMTVCLSCTPDRENIFRKILTHHFENERKGDSFSMMFALKF